jgi:signal transduction histidine kinase
VLRSTAILICSTLAASLAIAVAPHYGPATASEAAVFLVAIGVGALGVAHILTNRGRRFKTLSHQFNAGIALAVSQMLVAVVAIAALMFVSAEDAFMVAVIVAFSGAIAWRAARLMTVGILRDVEAVRDGLTAVGEGARDVQIQARAEDELGELAAEANAMVRRLRAGEKARRNLVAAVSHDLRTPITSLQLLADAVSDDIVDPKTRARYLDSMTTHIRALSTLIDDLFELSRLEAGDISWSVEPVALGQLVDETVEAMAVEARECGVHLEAGLGVGLPPVHANPEKLQRVLFNLIKNAICHTPCGGTVTVYAEPQDRWLEVEVQDTGSGIEAQDEAHIFDPFFRRDMAAAPNDSSAGLGLAISRAIIEAHGGRIWVVPRHCDSVGARIRFALPQAVSPTKRSAQASDLSVAGNP